MKKNTQKIQLVQEVNERALKTTSGKTVLRDGVKGHSFGASKLNV